MNRTVLRKFWLLTNDWFGEPETKSLACAYVMLNHYTDALSLVLISKKLVFHVQAYTSRNIPKDTRYTIHSGVPRWMLDKLKVNKIACKWRSISHHCKRSRDLPLYDLLILISQSSDWKQRKEKNHTQYSFSNTYRCCINNTKEFAT